MSSHQIINTAVTLFVIIDPIGNVPIFMVLTAGMQFRHRCSVAIRGALIGFFILAGFALSGTFLLDSMGITIDAFRVAGGLLLFYTAFEMIYSKRQERREEVSSDALKRKISDLAVFPLAIPLLAGPGAIAATILLSTSLQTTDGTYWGYGYAMLLGVLFGIMCFTTLLFMLSELLQRFLGRTGQAVLSRLFGVLMAALAVQYVADGARALAA